MNRERAGLNTLSVEYILGVSKNLLDDLAENRLVNLTPELGSRGGYEWGNEDIFRAFVAVDLIHKYEEKYRSKHSNYKYQQVRRDLIVALRSKKDDYLSSEAWNEVIERAKESGHSL